MIQRTFCSHSLVEIFLHVCSLEEPFHGDIYHSQLFTVIPILNVEIMVNFFMSDKHPDSTHCFFLYLKE